MRTMITWPKANLPKEDVVQLFKLDGTLVRGFDNMLDLAQYCDSIVPIDLFSFVPIGPDVVPAWSKVWYMKLSENFHHLLGKQEYIV